MWLKYNNCCHFRTCIILLHDWEGNTEEYSVRGWQYWPERSEGQYRSRELNIPPYCPTQRSAVLDLLYDLHTVLLVVHAQDSSLYSATGLKSTFFAFLHFG